MPARPMNSVTVPRRSAGSPRTPTQIRYTHIGAVYCNKMVLADEPSAIAEMNSAFISGESQVPLAKGRDER